MDKVVNWFLLLIIFVFDPLAIALVVAANMAFAQINPKRKEEDYFTSRNEHLEKIIEMKPPVGLREEDNITEPSEDLKQRVKENQEKLNIKENDEDYFSDLEGYIKYTREEDIENLTYPQFREKHYPKVEPTINTYGDDDWATPPKEEEITIDGGEIEVTVEPTKEEFSKGSDVAVAGNPKPEQLNDIKIPTQSDVKRLEEYLTNLPKKKDELYYNDTYEGELDRITDTTQTLIVKDNSKEKDEERTLTYRKRK